MRVKAYAKVNLALKIINKREDGYHNIATIMDLISIYDVLHISKCEDIIFTCSDNSLENEDNLVVKAIYALKDKCPVAKDYGVRIHLEKYIPYGAGLGGGSSDAAMTLVTLNKLWNLGLSFDELASIALSVGSDVPYFLLGGLGILTGTGENVNYIDTNLKLYYLLILPGYHCHTKDVYEANKIYSDDLEKVDNMISGFHTNNYDLVIDNMFNDLTDAAISVNDYSPKISNIIDNVNNLIIDNDIKAKAIMSGSGSTVIAAFNKKSDADFVYKKLKNQNYNVMLVTSKHNM
ncbi:MAG: 4-(cytidine 5'-diphospho)-2-C-methyl-D-erythritol kinase [Bacilli bacterium]|nr:4-(cytidine 5'-diphospho)-2-C-methyl-D-erythritol kinase [Bacilli bacterium]